MSNPNKFLKLQCETYMKPLYLHKCSAHLGAESIGNKQTQLSYATYKWLTCYCNQHSFDDHLHGHRKNVDFT
jgi:hypothetical protein